MLLWVPMLSNDANNANFQGSSKAQLNEKHFLKNINYEDIHNKKCISSKALYLLKNEKEFIIKAFHKGKLQAQKASLVHSTK